MPTYIFHIDLDAFLASVEQVLNPRLQGRPVIVGGEPGARGVVASASYEARKFGVKVAMPLNQAYRLCPQAAFLPGHFQHYSNASAQVMDIFRQFTPAVEEASLDEAYLDFTGFQRLYGGKILQQGPDDRWLLNLAQEIRKKVKEKTGLSVSIGIGTNKLIAKVVSNLAKPAGILLVRSGYEEKFLAPLEISHLPGIGKATQEKLECFNIKTIGDLKRLPRDILEASFGTYGTSLYERCRGLDDAEVVSEADDCKSISRETTFNEDTMDRTLIEGMLYYLTERAARDLRQTEMKARTVTVKVRYADFDTHSASRSLTQPTDRDCDFQEIALKLVDKLFTRRARVRLVGVAISGLSRPHSFQPGLFFKVADPPEAGGGLPAFGGGKAPGRPGYTKPLWRRREDFRFRDGLYQSLDCIRSRFGFSAVISGRAINLLGELKRDFYGFRKRTPPVRVSRPTRQRPVRVN
jgi:DNA polymerase-4